jgi:hypothetical protein
MIKSKILKIVSTAIALSTCRMSNSTALPLFFLSLFSLYATKGSYFIASFFIALAISCDLYCITFLAIFAFIKAKEFYDYSIDVKNKKIALEIFKAFLQLIVFPISIFLCIIGMDILLRNRQSKNSSFYTLEFHHSLKSPHMSNTSNNIYNIDYEKHYNDVYNKDEEGYNVDEYVMDGSFIQIINRKHKSYIKDLENPKATQFRPIRIIKIHQAQFEGEEKRFLRDEDFVELIDEQSGKYITLQDSDSKFIPLSYADADNTENNHNVWQISCDGYLTAHNTEFKLRHAKTGLFMGCRKFNSYVEMYGSIVSAIDARVFYISENKNAEYYKIHFKDERCRSLTKGYTKLSFIDLIKEYIKNIEINSNKSVLKPDTALNAESANMNYNDNADDSTDNIFEAEKSSGRSVENPVKITEFTKNSMFMFLGAFMIGLLFANHILRHRSKEMIHIKSVTYMYCWGFIFNMIFSALNGMNSQMLIFITLNLSFYTLSNFLESNRKVSNMNKKH